MLKPAVLYTALILAANAAAAGPAELQAQAQGDMRKLTFHERALKLKALAGYLMERKDGHVIRLEMPKEYDTPEGRRKVGEEIANQSIPLAEELGLTTAELSYLQDRRMAYENLAKRTNLEGVRAVSTALIQAERYGTPLGQALRVLAQENRDMRMAEAEKKAAGLPPKLTVPMILFFLPVLFVVILGPAAIRVMEIRN